MLNPSKAPIEAAKMDVVDGDDDEEKLEFSRAQLFWLLIKLFEVCNLACVLESVALVNEVEVGESRRLL